MSIHPSLRGADTLRGERSVLTRVERVQKLVAGETVTWDFEGKTRDIAFLNPDFGLINVDDPIALHVSAFGPKSRQLTAELGAGWLNFGAEESAAVSTLQSMQAAWRESGPPGQELYSTLFSLGCVLQPGEAADSERALAQAEGGLSPVWYPNILYQAKR